MRKTTEASEQAVSDNPAAAPRAPRAAPAPELPPELPPAEGGCWIRQPDGSLVRDPAEHPEMEA